MACLYQPLRPWELKLKILRGSGEWPVFFEATPGNPKRNWLTFLSSKGCNAPLVSIQCATSGWPPLAYTTDGYYATSHKPNKQGKWNIATYSTCVTQKSENWNSLYQNSCVYEHRKISPSLINTKTVSTWYKNASIPRQRQSILTDQLCDERFWPTRVSAGVIQRNC